MHCQQTLVDEANICHYCYRKQENAGQECPWCQKKVPLKANICRYCKCYTRKWRQYLKDWIIPFSVPIVTFLLVWAAFLQLDEIRQQRISADLAADRAKDAQCKTIDIGIDTIDLIQGYLDDSAGQFLKRGSPEYRKKLAEKESHLKKERQAVSCP